MADADLYSQLRSTVFMSLSDLDYVNAAVSRSEQQLRPSENGASSSTRQSDPASREGDAADAESRPPSSSSPSASPSSPSTTALSPTPGQSADFPEAVQQPSLASLLASLQTATLDAQSLGTSLSSPPNPPNDPTSAGEDDDDENEDEDLDLDSLKALLAKLDETEGAADDLEGRLDGLIDNLDALLGAMGGMALPDFPDSAKAAGETLETEKEK